MVPGNATGSGPRVARVRRLGILLPERPGITADHCRRGDILGFRFPSDDVRQRSHEQPFGWHGPFRRRDRRLLEDLWRRVDPVESRPNVWVSCVGALLPFSQHRAGMKWFH